VASAIEGRGLVAAAPIAQGEIAAIKGGHIVDAATLDSLPERRYERIAAERAAAMAPGRLATMPLRCRNVAEMRLLLLARSVVVLGVKGSVAMLPRCRCQNAGRASYQPGNHPPRPPHRRASGPSYFARP
jgi:hypothetical protein